PLLDSATELGEHRQILAHVDALLGPRSSGSVLLVPRAATADAATLTASLGAVAAAEFRRPVLLIDAARQQGGLATLFGLLEAPGWEELVAGLEPGQVIQSSGWAGVDVIPGGRRLAKTSARLWAEKTPDLLRRFAEDYRWLFLHGPAVTAGPWWLLLAGAVDGLCFVAADQQQAQLEHEALAAMACQTGRLLGNIVLA
ncbi:MAG TPA: hypothetical protein PKC45_13350, partial [Gemmatales bacterium]|nr:hypothetical protein [Gemmatales bacterium]